MNIVRNVHFNVSADELAEGYFVVSVNVQAHDGHYMRTDLYRKLSWTEAADVIYACFDEYRPGVVKMGGHEQQPLW